MQMEAQRPPAGVTRANGRIEVERWDVATKLPGRVAEIRVKEGDSVAKGAVIARMDVADLIAQKAVAQANVARAVQGIAKARTDVVSAEANLRLAEVEMRRSADLLDKAVSPQALVDQRACRAPRPPPIRRAGRAPGPPIPPRGR